MPENVGWIIPIDRIWFIVDVRILEYALFMNVTNNLSIIFFFYQCTIYFQYIIRIKRY